MHGKCRPWLLKLMEQKAHTCVVSCFVNILGLDPLKKGGRKKRREIVRASWQGHFLPSSVLVSLRVRMTDSMTAKLEGILANTAHIGSSQTPYMSGRETDDCRAASYQQKTSRGPCWYGSSRTKTREVLCWPGDLQGWAVK